MTHVMHFWLIKYSLLRGGGGDFNLTYIDPTPSKYTRQNVIIIIDKSRHCIQIISSWERKRISVFPNWTIPFIVNW